MPPDGRKQNLLKVTDWDFAWQEQYTYRERIALPKGTRLDTEVVWDNSAENIRNPTNPPVPVRWGIASADEMGSVTVGVIPRKNEDLEIGVDLGLGKGTATVWTCDLTHRYIDINADYRS